MRKYGLKSLAMCALGALGCSGEDDSYSETFAIGVSEWELSTAYYVATNGNDGNPGTATRPWRTLQHAVDTAEAGSTILVSSGNYAGVRIERSGRPDAATVLKAVPGARPVLTSPGPRNRHSSIVEVESFSGRVSHWLIDGFEVARAPRAGIDLRNTEHITVSHCFVHDSGMSGRATGIFLAFSDHPTIEFNESSNNAEHGIYQSNSGDDAVIRGNRLHHNVASGIHLNGDASYGGDGVVSRSIIEDNVIFENGAIGGSGINMDGASDSLVRNNLLYENHASGISLFQYDGAEASSRNRIYNNTIVQARGSRWAINVDSSGSPSGNRVMNNVLYHPDSNRGVVSTYSASASGFSSDYNVVIGRFSANGQSSTLSLADWQQLGHDRHSRTATPESLFVNLSSGNFHHRAGSVAIDSGSRLTDVDRDAEGTRRPQGATHDIGCYESGSVAPSSGSGGSTGSGGSGGSTSAGGSGGSTSAGGSGGSTGGGGSGGTGGGTDPVPTGCTEHSAGQPFHQRPLSLPGQTFEVIVEALPLAQGIDGVLALASGQASTWSELAAIARFNSAGRIDVRDGGSYRADRTVSYSAGTPYRVRFSVDLSTKRYSVYVRPEGGVEQTVAENYAFRTEQQNVAALDRVVTGVAAGTLAVCSADVVSAPVAAGECIDVSPDSGWENASFVPSSSTVRARWVVTPSSASVDGAVALSAAAASGWRDLAAIVRFAPNGTIDVRDGTVYRADRAVSYGAGASYTVRIVANPATRTYSAYVTAPGATEVTLASGYRFRTEQSTISELSHATLAIESGALEVCDFSVQ